MKRARRNKIAGAARPIALFLIGAAVFFALFASTASEPVRADPGWWDTNWTNRRLITITGTHPENYQIKVVIPRSPNMQPDYDDLRFLENDTVGVLDYWIENHTTDNVTVWVRRLENTQLDNTIYVYYGNPAATSVSSGVDTFIFFDNFEAYTLGTLDGQGGWTVRQATAGQGTIDVVSLDGRKQIDMLGGTATTGGFGAVSAYRDIGTFSNVRIRSYGKAIVATEWWGVALFDGVYLDWDINNGYHLMWGVNGNTTVNIGRRINGSQTYIGSVSWSRAAGTYSISEFIWFP